MKKKSKKIILPLLAVSAIIVSLPLMSAFEAHVINVTAHIENALRILPPEELTFGTVFPQEYMEKRLWISSSESFCASDQRRVLNIDYKIVQKPKPIWPPIAECEPLYSPEITINDARAYCHDNPSDLNCCYESLCPYLSKIPAYEEPGDLGVPAFHDPNDPSSVAVGTINKDTDLADEWIIDLAVPCFDGMCAQDYADFVHDHNPDANPDDYILPAESESSDFGCDLWIEVTDIF
ncbi:hypothetical protein KAS41_03775 [Candidatus Parcubacteria bacterium]|nr:hypothetical protein [Candidatus Parcubacteria bacterium]